MDLQEVEHVTRMGDRRGVYRDLVGRQKGRRPLGRSKRRRKDNIKMDLQEVEHVTRMGERRGGNEPLGSIKSGEFLDLLRTR